ncbi:MAG: bacillithiol biosynthesis deacetylase BshB1, partial [Gemmatimonadota bacterium]
HRPPKLLYALAYREADAPAPSFVVDISDQIERKLDAIFAYASQFGGRNAIGGVFGGGDRPLRDQILAHHAHYGSLVRCRFGEPFHTREVQRVDDVVDLPVNSI